MIVASVGLLAVAASMSAQSSPTPGRAEPSVVFHVPSSIDPTGLMIDYGLVGEFGGFFSFISAAPNVRDYPLVTTRDGKLAHSITGYALRFGYGIVTFSEDLTTGPASRTIPLDFKPLEPAHMTGEVTLPEGVSPDGLILRTFYDQVWECEFFDLIDCMHAAGTGPKTPLRQDGSFAIDLQNYPADPALAPYPDKGVVSLSLTDASGHSIAVDPGVLAGLTYPKHLHLVATFGGRD